MLTKLSLGTPLHVVFYYFLAGLFISAMAFGVSTMKPDIRAIDTLFKDIDDCRSYISKLEYIRYLIWNHAKSEPLHRTLIGLLDLHFEELEGHQQRKLTSLLAEDSLASFEKDELREFVKFLHERYLTGIKQFKEDNDLIISYCYFLKETDTSVHKKKKIAEHTASIVHGYFSSYETYCLTHIDNHQSDTSSSQNRSDDDSSSSKDIDASKTARLFYALMRDSVADGHRLMDVLSAESPEIERLLDAFQEFGMKKMRLEEEWAAKRKVLGKDAEVLERYGIYVKYVLHSARNGDKLIKEARSIEEKQKTFGAATTELDLKTLFEKISQISYPLLILKYDNNEVIIENCNQSFCKIVRYKRFEVLEKSTTLSYRSTPNSLETAVLGH